MSRIGKKPVIIPANVTVNVAEGNVVTVKGPKGELTNTFNADMIINVEGNVLTVSRPTDEANHRALHGLTRTLIANMVEGVEKGYAKELEVSGAMDHVRIVDAATGNEEDDYFDQNRKDILRNISNLKAAQMARKGEA